MSETTPNPEEKTFRAIGRFIFEFSQVEYTIRYYLAEEIGLKEEHFTPVVESYDTAMLCNVAKEVFAKRRPGQFFARVEECIKCFQKLNNIRNRVAHGLWVPFKEGGTVHYVPRNLNVNPGGLQNQAEDLEKYADQLNALRAKLEGAFGAYLYQPDF
jgi:hypothetical protein